MCAVVETRRRESAGADHHTRPHRGGGIDLFATRGFDDTSVDDIAEQRGSRVARSSATSRRRTRCRGETSTRIWPRSHAARGDARRRAILDNLVAAVLEFNTFPPEVTDGHRRRMELIFVVPALQAYSVVMYEGWRKVIAEYVAGRLHLQATDQLPRTVGYLMLGVAMGAYETWLADDSADLIDLLTKGSRMLYTDCPNCTSRY